MFFSELSFCYAYTLPVSNSVQPPPLPFPPSLGPLSGIAQQLGVNWLSRAFNPVTGVNGMAEDEVNGAFNSDDLLARVQADLGAFYWQSHTLTHLARDNLGANDCDIEDGGELC